VTSAHETTAEPPERSVLQVGTGLPRAVALLLGAASAVVVAAGLHAVSWLVGPLFLALVIVITVYPVQTWLRNVGIPGWAATMLLVLLVYAVLIVLAATIVISIAQLATLLPTFAVDANAVVNGLSSLLARVGVGNVQLAAIASSLSIGKLVAIVTSLLLGVTGLIGNAVFLLSLLLFLSIDAPGIDTRLGLLSHSNARMATALDGFARATRRYISVNTTFGVLTGAVDMIVLWAIGVPLAPLWGLLVFLTNYIPYLGFWIGLGPPALLAALVGGWPLLLSVVGVFMVVNFVLTSLVQPKFVGDAVGLSVTTVLVALVFWGWLLGILGAVLATPLTLLVKVVLIDVDPRARWVHALIGPARPSPDVDGM
jgi:predicted PurR-regulated permease PerM